MLATGVCAFIFSYCVLVQGDCSFCLFSQSLSAVRGEGPGSAETKCFHPLVRRQLLDHPLQPRAGACNPCVHTGVVHVCKYVCSHWTLSASVETSLSLMYVLDDFHKWEVYISSKILLFNPCCTINSNVQKKRDQSMFYCLVPLNLASPKNEQGNSLYILLNAVKVCFSVLLVVQLTE